MSRVGKKVIKIPAGVKVSFASSIVKIEGKVGKLEKVAPLGIAIEVAGDEVKVVNKATDGSKGNLHGLWRTLVSNMVQGVSIGYTRVLELQGVGYRAQAQGQKLTMSLGFSHPVEFPLPIGIQAAVEANTKITLKGADKELLGLTAARLREVRPPEPYKGKGIRFAGEKITLKQGKTAGAGGGK